MKTDFQLKQDVIDELSWDSAVEDTRVGVEVVDGIVTLSGHLDSYAQKYAAEKAAQRVADVKGLAVELKVILPGGSQRMDSDIAHTAEQGLQWNALLPRNRIKIMVENGWITLRGEVDQVYQRAAAENTLRNLLGVTGISNQLVVKPAVVAGDIKKNIEAALKRRAILGSQAVQIAVDEGQVTLSGTLGSLAEKTAAHKAAAATVGVVAVIDKIAII